MNEIIPYHRPYPLNHEDKSKIHARLNEVLFIGQLTNGKYVRELEDTIKEMYNTEYCIATSSCTQGLMACLEYGVPHGVQLPTFNWWSDKYVLDFLKYEKWYNDIDKDTWLVEEEFRNRSLFVHTFGNVGISEKEEVIYDASHCLGAKLVEVGLASVFSLAPTKLVTACEGGLVITNDKGLAEFVIERRDKMSRMSEIHAIIGLQTLKHLKEIMEWKALVFHYYNSQIEGNFQRIPFWSNYNTIGFLNVNNLVIPKHIETKQYYEPLKKGLPNTDYVYENIICLPSWYGVDYEKIVEDILNVQK